MALDVCILEDDTPFKATRDLDATLFVIWICLSINVIVLFYVTYYFFFTKRYSGEKTIRNLFVACMICSTAQQIQ